MLLDKSSLFKTSFTGIFVFQYNSFNSLPAIIIKIKKKLIKFIDKFEQ